jgi:hypothetical protein
MSKDTVSALLSEYQSIFNLHLAVGAWSLTDKNIIDFFPILCIVVISTSDGGATKVEQTGIFRGFSLKIIKKRSKEGNHPVLLVVNKNKNMGALPNQLSHPSPCRESLKYISWIWDGVLAISFWDYIFPI